MAHAGRIQKDILEKALERADLCAPHTGMNILVAGSIDLFWRDYLEEKEIYCGRDKGKPKGRLLNRGSMAGREGQILGTRWVELVLVRLSKCLVVLCLVDARRQSLCP
jgi:hypothetical protein